MKIKRLFRPALMLILIWALSGTSAPAEDSAKPAGEWEGYVSSLEAEFIRVVVDPAEWTDLWKKAFNKPAPEVDFQTHAVACVFLGYSAKWLYSIEFEEPVLRDGRWVINYALLEMQLRLSGPFKASGQYRMKVLPKQKVPMVLEEVTPPF